jgi:hypothetical protein
MLIYPDMLAIWDCRKSYLEKLYQETGLYFVKP